MVQWIEFFTDVRGESGAMEGGGLWDVTDLGWNSGSVLGSVGSGSDMSLPQKSQ